MPINSNINIPDKCLECGKTFKKKNADLLSEGESAFIFHLTCDNCGTSYILNIAVGRDGILTVGTLTDAGKEDLDKLRNGKLVSADDVIEAYMALRNKAQ
ncbi:MAG: hypothetical protein V1690_01350 [Candidatus Moraniibacteriota bacterium]